MAQTEGRALLRIMDINTVKTEVRVEPIPAGLDFSDADFLSQGGSGA